MNEEIRILRARIDTLEKQLGTLLSAARRDATNFDSVFVATTDGVQWQSQFPVDGVFEDYPGGPKVTSDSDPGALVELPEAGAVIVRQWGRAADGKIVAYYVEIGGSGCPSEEPLVIGDSLAGSEDADTVSLAEEDGPAYVDLWLVGDVAYDGSSDKTLYQFKRKIRIRVCSVGEEVRSTVNVPDEECA